SEARTIRRLADALSPADAGSPILIPRLVGIEDSSRNWSVFMTIEHLVIVDGIVLSILESLCSEKTLDLYFSTADVKPPIVQEAGVLDRFTRVVDSYSETIRRLGSLRT